jgi:hypothetical protein
MGVLTGQSCESLSMSGAASALGHNCSLASFFPISQPPSTALCGCLSNVSIFEGSTYYV